MENVPRLPLTENATVSLIAAKEAAERIQHTHVLPQHLLYGLSIIKTGCTSAILRKYGLDPVLLLRFIEKIPPESDDVSPDVQTHPLTEQLLDRASDIARWFDNSKTDTIHLLIALVKEPTTSVNLIFRAMNIRPGKIYIDAVSTLQDTPETLPVSDTISEPVDNNTPALDQYARDITRLARDGKLDPVIGRDTEVKRIIHILSRRGKNNPCLIGEPGVGKTAIVESLANRIIRGNVPESLLNKRVLALSLTGLVAGTNLRGDFEERIQSIINEVTKAGNILLFIDELHTIIGAGGSGQEGSLDASNILKPYLARGELQIIGATTISEYRRYIEQDLSLERRFQPVMVEEPTEEEAIRIISGIAYKYEIFHEVTISDEAIKAAVHLSARYINDRRLPDKAIDLLDETSAARSLSEYDFPDEFRREAEEIDRIEACMEKAIHRHQSVESEMYRKQRAEMLENLASMKQEYLENRRTNREIIISANDISQVIADWTGIPVSDLNENESERYLMLEERLHKRVIGQDEAVSAVSKAVRRGRVGLQDPAKPIGTFLFLGPTGVGKTELSKALSDFIFGSEGSMIRLDMSEYMEPHSVAKIIGSPPGYVGFEDGGQLCEKVRNHPYSLILLDEIEKAHPDIFNILLQILDDGHITDSKGRKVDFKNTILIMTSNAGIFPEDSKQLGFSTSRTSDVLHQEQKDKILKNIKLYFKPEFLNRIDETIVFHALTEKEMHQILDLLLDRLSERCFRQMELKLEITRPVRKYIIENYINLQMGARPLKRAVQTVIEDPLSEAVLKGEIRRGDTIHIELKKKQVIFHTRSEDRI